MFENGLSGGGGHGGKGGNGYYDGNFVEGGVAYGNAGLPCELGSGSGNNSLAGATAGGGIIGKYVMRWIFGLCHCGLNRETDVVNCCVQSFKLLLSQ